MLSLPDLQTAMAAALRDGPEHVPLALFRGASARVLLGFKVHANTVSHARLIALEESFPRSRAAMGEARFNYLSRRFLDSGGGALAVLANIGEDFPEWLTQNGAGAKLGDLARIDWAWLESWRATDAPALTLADLAGLDQAQVLALQVRRHPAARLVMARRSVLITRPYGSIDIRSAAPAMATLFAALAQPAPIGILLALPVSEPLAVLTEALASGLISPQEPWS